MRFIIALFFIIIILFQTSIALFGILHLPQNKEPIKVGLVHSLTGFRAPQERVVQQATLMAIEEINQKGGIFDRKIIPIIRDAESNEETTQSVVFDLIVNEKVKSIFGGWMPDIDDSIKKIFEKNDALLLYPYRYQGIITSENLIFFGTSCNQQIPPSIRYCLDHFGNRFFILATDYLLNHLTTTVIQDLVNTQNGTIVGQHFTSPGELTDNQIDEIIKMIHDSNPSIILNSLEGSQNSLFFKKLRAAKIAADQIPVFCFDVTEQTLEDTNNSQDFIGGYATRGYFQSLENPINQQFVKDFLNFSQLNVVDDQAESAYMSVLFWSQAIKEADNSNGISLHQIFENMHMQSPGGPVTLSLDGRYLWKYSRIGQIMQDGQFDVIWESSQPRRPISHPIFRTQDDWNALIKSINGKSKR